MLPRSSRALVECIRRPSQQAARVSSTGFRDRLFHARGLVLLGASASAGAPWFTPTAFREARSLSSSRDSSDFGFRPSFGLRLSVFGFHGRPSHALLVAPVRRILRV